MLDYGYDEPRDSSFDLAPVPKPTVRMTESGENYGMFVIEPLPRGYGVTLGNPLRRVLLSSIQGSAISSVKIEGVEHEYSTVPYVKEGRCGHPAQREVHQSAGAHQQAGETPAARRGPRRGEGGRHHHVPGLRDREPRVPHRHAGRPELEAGDGPERGDRQGLRARCLRRRTTHRGVCRWTPSTRQCGK